MINTKGSHLAELIHELTNMDIGDSNITRYGDFVDDDTNVKAIRLSRYASIVEGSTSYDHYARNLVQQTLTELTFMSLRECLQLLKRLDFISERFTRAWELYFKHYQLFYEGKFSSLEFEWAFFRLFNIPVRRAGAMDAVNFNELRTTDDFWSDLHDALMYKQGILLELTHDLRDIYNISQPTDKSTSVEDNAVEGIGIKELSDQERSTIYGILAPLGGFSPTGLHIMNATDFGRLFQYTEHLILYNSLPSDIQVIQQTNISVDHIRYTFHRLHERLFTTKRIRNTFIEFLHKVFRQFETYETKTTRKKFGTAPSSYFTDFNIYQ